MKVLVGVDGSSNSFAAGEFVGHLLSPERDELVLLFATPLMAFDDERLDPTIEQRARSALSRAVLDTAIERLSSSWQARIQKREVSGLPSQEILAAIATERADMVVVGFRGTSGILAEFIMGSVSRAIVHSAQISVLVVKSSPGGEGPAKQSPGSAVQHLRVLATYDGSPIAERMAALLKRLTWPPETQAWVMTVVKPLFLTELPDWVEQPPRDPDVAAMAQAWQKEHDASVDMARSELELFRATLPERLSGEEVIVAEGRPAEQIVATLRQKAIDLAVVGSRGRGPVQRLLLGSTSSQVLAAAPCSVLIVR
jgi:nucleotide-binding universal stress UspA family protein